jgi:hypothetical protein
MNAKAKFMCRSVKDYGNNQKEYEFAAISADEIPENQRYHKWTPSGSLSMMVTNPAVVFEPTKSYYLDITPAE